ncbi:hypothetical protein E2C01_035487 [Portunus trituberculatus]|uniref:Uncharacterized protein n=1 Tax=Portunus trituberculatus TaxID=210409 RepID=A0A5B7F3B1_PORTR|nr:hypothetical protein [Portunus trituberculatus]
MGGGGGGDKRLPADNCCSLCSVELCVSPTPHTHTHTHPPHPGWPRLALGLTTTSLHGYGSTDKAGCVSLSRAPPRDQWHQLLFDCSDLVKL